MDSSPQNWQRSAWPMRQILSDYTVTPSVVPAGKEVTVTIAPRGKNTAFVAGEQYRLTIRPVEKLLEHFARLNCEELTLTPDADGCLRFTRAFYGEQAHMLNIEVPKEYAHSPNPYFSAVAKCPALRCPTLCLYSVKEDLLGRTVHKGDLHIHSMWSDGHEDCGGIAGNLRAAGYDFMAITDHYLMDYSEEAVQTFRDAPDVMTLLTGEEIHVPAGRVHIVGIGPRESVNEYFRRHKAECEAEEAEIEKELTDLPAEIDKNDYAWRVWIARKVKSLGGFSIMAHPHWLWNNCFFVHDLCAAELLRRGEFDAFELLNGGIGPIANNLQTALYTNLRAEGVPIPVVGSSDSHSTEKENGEAPGECYTLVFSKGRDFASLTQAIREGYSVAVEQYPGEPVPRVYGDYRMVKLALFFLHIYYPVYTELCREQGRQLRLYAADPKGGAAEALAKLKAESDRFTAAFFGAGE